MKVSEKTVINRVPIVLLWDQYEEDDDENIPYIVTDEPLDLEANIKKTPKRRLSATLRQEIEVLRNRRYFQPINDTKRKVIGEIAEDINQIDRIKQYRLKYICATFLCFLTSIIGGFVLLFGLAITDLFNNRKRNYIVIACSSILFIPFMFWIRFYFFPSKSEQEKHKQSQMQIRRQAKMRKKQRYLDKGLGDEYRLEDEYIPTVDDFVPRTEYLATTPTRMNFFDSANMKQATDGEIYPQVANYSEDNGYMNDYYFRNILYKDMLPDPTSLNSPKLLVDQEHANIRIWGGDPALIDATHKKRKDFIPPILHAKSSRSILDLSEIKESEAKDGDDDDDAELNKPVDSPKLIKSSSHGSGKSSKKRAMRRKAKAATSPIAS